MRRLQFLRGHQMRQPQPRSWWLLVGVAIALLLVANLVTVQLHARPAAAAFAPRGQLPVGPLPQVTVTVYAQAPAHGTRGSVPPVVNGGPAAAPKSVAIPAISVQSTLQYLQVGADNTLPPPSNFTDAGWWAGGTRPGDPGPAVLVGHVDSVKGPAVFFRLKDLKPGMPVRVTRSDGTVAVFAVDALRQFPKERFPTALVYGATSAPTLRLITCGGSFDESVHSYRDNIVVFAHLTGIEPAVPAAHRSARPAAQRASAASAAHA